MQSSDTIDYKELYEQSQKENFFLREEFKQLRAVNEQLVTGWNNYLSSALAVRVNGIWERNKRLVSSG